MASDYARPWKGTLGQYVGRLHRKRHSNREHLAYDDVGSVVAMPVRMELKSQSIPEQKRLASR